MTGEAKHILRAKYMRDYRKTHPEYRAIGALGDTIEGLERAPKYLRSVQ